VSHIEALGIGAKKQNSFSTVGSDRQKAAVQARTEYRDIHVFNYYLT